MSSTITSPPPTTTRPGTPPAPPINGRPVVSPPQNAATSAISRRKTFTVSPWTGAGEGKKIMVYGPSGMGKTTLATMAPNPIFIGIDDGGRETRNPKTGQAVNAVPGVETFSDLRDALHETSLYPAASTLVLDTITKAESLAEAHTLATVRGGDGLMANLEEYGYGKGYKHLLDTMRLLLGDLDALIRRGVNVLLLAQQSQATVSNLEGLDFLQDGPALATQPKAGANVRGEYCAWVDHIFRIGYPVASVRSASGRATKGKATGETTRVIYTEPEVYFVAKNRSNGVIPPTVSFGTRADDSIWEWVFNGPAVAADQQKMNETDR